MNLVNPPRAHTITNYLRYNLEAKGLVGEKVMKAIHFFLREVLKLEFYDIQVFTPATPDQKGAILISVYDKLGNEVYIKPKTKLLNTFISFVNLPTYEIKFNKNG